MMSSLVKSYLPIEREVSQSRASQVLSVLKLSPSRQREGEGQLIRRQGLQNRKLAHQLGFGDALNWHLKGVLASFWLTDQDHGTRIKVNGHTAVGKALAQGVVRGSSVKDPIRANVAEPSALCQIAAHLLQSQ